MLLPAERPPVAAREKAHAENLLKLRMGRDFDSALPGDRFRSVWEFGNCYAVRPRPMTNKEADEREHENEGGR